MRLESYVYVFYVMREKLNKLYWYKVYDIIMDFFNLIRYF